MVRVASLFCIILLAVYASSLPNTPQEKKKDVVCAEGELLSTDGKCIKTLENSQPQNATAEAQPKRKKSVKRRKLQKKLAQEMKDIKKLVLSGLDKETLQIPVTNCPEGQEFNIYGDCVPITREVVNGTDAAVKKPNRSQRLQKKLERELEIALKKEIQNELKRKRRNKKKDSKAVTPGSTTTAQKSPQDGSRNHGDETNPEEMPVAT